MCIRVNPTPGETSPSASGKRTSENIFPSHFRCYLCGRRKFLLPHITFQHDHSFSIGCEQPVSIPVVSSITGRRGHTLLLQLCLLSVGPSLPVSQQAPGWCIAPGPPSSRGQSRHPPL